MNSSTGSVRPRLQSTADPRFGLQPNATPVEMASRLALPASKAKSRTRPPIEAPQAPISSNDHTSIDPILCTTASQQLVASRPNVVPSPDAGADYNYEYGNEEEDDWGQGGDVNGDEGDDNEGEEDEEDGFAGFEEQSQLSEDHIRASEEELYANPGDQDYDMGTRGNTRE